MFLDTLGLPGKRYQLITQVLVEGNGGLLAHSTFRSLLWIEERNGQRRETVNAKSVFLIMDDY
jgi:hypothetical protein